MVLSSTPSGAAAATVETFKASTFRMASYFRSPAGHIPAALLKTWLCTEYRCRPPGSYSASNPMFAKSERSLVGGYASPCAAASAGKSGSSTSCLFVMMSAH